MAKVKGQNLRVLVGGKCIAMATNANVQIQMQTESSSTKDDTDDWDVNDIVGKSWTMNCDSLATTSDNGSNGMLMEDLLELILAGTPVTLLFDVTSGTNNRTATSSPIALTGTAYIQNVSIDAPNRQNSKLRTQFLGTGALAAA